MLSGLSNKVFKLSKYVMCLWLPVLWCAGSLAQPFVTYGGNWQDNASRIRVINDQLVVVGQSATLSAPAFHGFVLVASLDLDSLVFYYHTDTLETTFYLDIVDTGDGYFVCGNITNYCCSTGTNATLTRLTESFEVDSVVEFGGEYNEMFHHIVRLHNYYYLIGYTKSYTTEPPGINSCDPYIVKSNLNGNTIWEKNPGTTQFEAISAAVVNANQTHILCAGGSTSTGDFYDGYVIKLDTSGTAIWRKLYKSGPLRVEYFYAVTATQDGGGLAAGTATPNGSGIQGPYLVRFDENGDTLWTKVLYRFNEPATSPYNIRWKNSEVWDAVTLSDGSFVVSGNWYNEAHQDQDIFIYKFDVNGDSLWRVDLGNEFGHDKGMSITVHNDFIYVAGSYTHHITENGYKDVLLIKLDPNGCTVDTCLVTIAPPTVQSSTKPFSVYPNPAGNILNVQFGNVPLQQSASILISDASGRTVLHQACIPRIGIERGVSNNANVSVQDLLPGLYIAELRLKNGERYFQRFVKQ